MGKCKRLVTLAVLFMCASFCFAKQISFQVVQHDFSASSVTEQSLVIEDEVLTSFFESGFIVTNSNAAVSDSKNQDAVLFKSGIGEAFNGSSDFFVQINLYYEITDSTTSSDADLQKIEFTIAKTNTGTTIANRSLKSVKTGNKNLDLKKVSSNLVSEINKALNAYRA